MSNQQYGQTKTYTDKEQWELPRLWMYRIDPRSSLSGRRLQDSRAELMGYGFDVLEGGQPGYYLVQPPSGWTMVQELNALELADTGKAVVMGQDAVAAFFVDHGNLSERPVLHYQGNGRYRTFGYPRSQSQSPRGHYLLAAFVMFVACAGFIAALAIGVHSTRITDDEALARFQTLLNTEQVEIVHSEFVGNRSGAGAYQYELLVDGERYATGDCTKKIFSKLICRVYT